MTRLRRRAWTLSGPIALSIIGIVGLSPRQEKGRPATAPAPRAEDGRAADLRVAAERFIAAADKADADAIRAAYDPAFVCVRVADEGGFARLSREQMLGFFARPGAQAKGTGHAIPTKETTIHHVETIGDTGYVLLTRVKDLGHGWEPMFYTLVWTRTGDGWHLLREFVHQKSIPRRL